MRLVRVSRWSSFSCYLMVFEQNPNILIVTYIMPANGQSARAALPDTLLRDSRRCPRYADFQRRIGLRAAAASSAMERIASMNKSHSCFDSDSVGSIIMAPGTISGKAVVYGWKP